MYQKERLDSIMALLHRHGYVTVKFLSEELHYSTATVNRDLNLLEQMKQVRRSYGGVEPTEAQGVSLLFRYAKSKPAKKRIGKCAAQLVRKNDVIFIDGTTTTQYMGPYLAAIEGITVITNNMALAPFLSEHSVRVIVLGGEVVEAPFMLDGNDTLEIASRYDADKCFFSAVSLSKGGEIGTGMGYYALHQTMIRNSDSAYLLIDKEKLWKKYHRSLGDLSGIHGVISAHAFDEEWKQRFPNVQFICSDKECDQS